VQRHVAQPVSPDDEYCGTPIAERRVRPALLRLAVDFRRLTAACAARFASILIKLARSRSLPVFFCEKT
jgi:hypothetical protein